MLQDVKAAEPAEPRPRTRIRSIARVIQPLRFVAERDVGPARFPGHRECFIRAARSAARLAHDGLTEAAGGDGDSAS
jgi:hypothetical protein